MNFRPLQVLFFIFYVLFFLQARAQTIRGKVFNAKTNEPLEFTNVFINNTTIGSTTNEKGAFIIQGDLPPNIELVASFVGFKTVSRKLEFGGKSILEINFQLEPLESMLTEVETKSRRDKRWERQLDKFERVFLAVPDDPILKEIEIENPWVLNFETVKEKGPNFIQATADQPLILENKALGYEITYYLQDYKFYKNKSQYLGLAFFKDQEPSDSVQERAWEDHKESSYLGSSRHLFRSFLVRKAEVEGFKFYKKNPMFFSKMRTNSLEIEMGKSISPVSQDSIRRIPLKNGNFRIIIPFEMEIHYEGKDWRNEYYTDYYHPISWISAPKGFFDIDRNGIPIDPTQVVLSGYMGRQRMGRFLPYDFRPTEGFESNVAEVDSLERLKNQVNNLREKPWITTNKSYYYPGETVWFHVKMLYHNPLMVDTLSRTLYMDVLNSDYQIVQSEVFPIEQGKVSSGFILSDSLLSDDYVIRSYTNWMRNFPDRDITLVPLPVLSKGEVLVSDDIPELDFFGDLTIKESHRKMNNSGQGKVEITLQFLDETEEPTSAEFTVSLTDPSLVGVISGRQDLDAALSWLDQNSDISFEYLKKFPIEYGISVNGLFERTKKKQPYINPITIVQGDLEDYGIVKTDSSGYFRATGLYFTDSTTLYIAALDQKNNPYGLVHLIGYNPLVFKGSFPVYEYQTKESSGYLQKYDVNGEYIELEEFVKEDQEIKRLADDHYGYGEPDREFTPTDLENWTGRPLSEVIGMKYGNGKLGNFNYGINSGEPLLIIDGQRYFYQEGETGMEVLGRYLTDEVESISVYTMNSTIFGVAGFAGVIMFNTKMGGIGSRTENKFNSTGFQQFKLRGYSDPMNFQELNQFINKGNKPTVFWDPEAKADETMGYTFSFTPEEGVDQYNLFIEGMTEQGFPFTKIIQVKLND